MYTAILLLEEARILDSLAYSSPTADRHTVPPRAILNLCMPYAARNDIAFAVDSTIEHAIAEGWDRYARALRNSRSADGAAHPFISPFAS